MTRVTFSLLFICRPPKTPMNRVITGVQGGKDKGSEDRSDIHFTTSACGLDCSIKKRALQRVLVIFKNLA